MPFNQLFNFFVTEEFLRRQKALTAGQPLELVALEAKIKKGLSFLRKQYLVESPEGKIVGLSRIMGRDLVLRSVYASLLFGLYVTIERELLSRHERRAFPFHTPTI
jgi:hypothetical protein